MQESTHYDLLEVREGASTEVIKGAYKHLTQKWHPDRNAAFRDEAEQMTKRLNEAYGVLSDPIKRAEYDRYLRERYAASEVIATESAPTQKAPPSPTRNKRVLALTTLFLFSCAALLLTYGVLSTGVGMDVKLEYAAEECRSDYLFATVKNRLPIELKSHSFSVSGTEEGHSRPKYTSRSEISYEIIPAYSSISKCVRAPFESFYYVESADIDSIGEYILREPNLIWTTGHESADWGIVSSFVQH